jgi:hypothetical protein
MYFKLEDELLTDKLIIRSVDGKSKKLNVKRFFNMINILKPWSSDFVRVKIIACSKKRKRK